MSKNRMAGDALNEDTAESEAASDAVATSEQNKTLMDRYGEDYVDRVKADGLQDGNKFSRKELAAEFRYGRGDTSVDDTVAKYQGMVDSGKYNGNNKAQEFLEMHGVDFGNVSKPDEPDVVIDDPEVTPTDPNPVSPFPVAGPGPGPIQTINPGNPGDTDGLNVNVNQDNDITNNINGNDNVVTNNQDNSISAGGYGKQSASSDFKNMWMNNFFN
jgi:hypothetical protein